MKGIFSFLRKRPARFVPVDVLLSRMMRKDDRAVFQARLIDRRLAFETAAEILSVSSEDVLFRVARELGLPIVTQVQPLDRSQISSLQVIENLRTIAAIPLILSPSGLDAISGVVCADPALLPLEAQKSHLYLGTWTQIGEALELSERAFREGSPGKELIVKRLAAERVVELAAKHAEGHGARQFEIATCEKGVRYLFQTKENLLAEGEINSQMLEPLRSYLSELSNLEPPGQMVAFEGIKFSIRAAVITDKERYSLKITPADAEAERVMMSEPIIGSYCADSDYPEAESELEPARPGLTTAAPGLSDCSKASDVGTKSAEQWLTLLIDDNKCFSRVIRRFFERQDFRAVHTESCEQALAMLQSGEITPDVVVCDLHMPGMSGFEFVATVRSFAAFSGLPIIMLTSDANVETEVKLIQSGADIFLNKTDDPRVLCAHARKLAERRKAA